MSKFKDGDIFFRSKKDTWMSNLYILEFPNRMAFNGMKCHPDVAPQNYTVLFNINSMTEKQAMVLPLLKSSDKDVVKFGLSILNVDYE
jgi:hypothetical protein